VKVREAGRIISVVTIASRSTPTARARCSAWRSALQMAETFWVLRKLKRRGLAGVKLVISDAHGGKGGRRTRVRCQLAALPGELAALLNEAEADVLANMSFPKEHRGKLHSTNPLERARDQAPH
jgi:transposase-like protein